MRSRRTALLVAALTVGSLSLAPANAAEFADDCVDGPASTASAAAPHIWDGTGDLQPFAVHGDAADLRAGWISKTATGFAANIQVTNLANAVTNIKYLFSYTGTSGEHYVSADKQPTGWVFETGHLDTTQTPQRQVTDGPTTGSVDATAGVITVNLPAAAVPAPSADGSEVEMPVLGIKSQLLVGAAGRGGLLQTDDATYVCRAVVHEAQPQSSEEPTPAP